MKNSRKFSLIQPNISSIKNSFSLLSFFIRTKLESIFFGFEKQNEKSLEPYGRIKKRIEAIRNNDKEIRIFSKELNEKHKKYRRIELHQKFNFGLKQD